ncbi:MAG: helix-turn-helix transcriptional regulator [Firmicutes bacterium]|nr:helix-turn-helix transcriptional regulator [Bacillota bacterium]
MVEITLNEVLNNKDKTLYWLAKETEISYTTIHKLAKGGTKSISFEILEKICTVLECTPNDIIKIVKE